METVRAFVYPSKHVRSPDTAKKRRSGEENPNGVQKQSLDEGLEAKLSEDRQQSKIRFKKNNI